MTIIEKLLIQQQNTNQIYLFKEGIFWKVYNQGVYHLKELNYKIAINHNKKSNQTYASIGFPDSVVKKLKPNYKLVSQEETKIVFAINESALLNESYYQEWFEDISKNIPSKSTITLIENELINQIKNYPLATKTPIEAFLWLSDIQSKL